MRIAVYGKLINDPNNSEKNHESTELLLKCMAQPDSVRRILERMCYQPPESEFIQHQAS